jgi:hypothetical protein
MRLALKRLITLTARLVILVILFRYASTYFLSRKATMPLAPVIALSHGGGEIALTFINLFYSAFLSFFSTTMLSIE